MARRRPPRNFLMAASLLRVSLTVVAAMGVTSVPSRHFSPFVAPAFAEDGHGGADGGGDGGDGGGDGGGSGGGEGGDGGDKGGGEGGSGSSGSGGDDGGGDDGGSANSGSGSESEGSGANSAGSGTGTGSSIGTKTTGGDGGQHGDFMAGEIVAIADRPEVLTEAEHLGFQLIDERPLDGLGLSVLRLRTPVHVEPQRGLAMLHQAMPELVADVNSLYDSYRTQSSEVVSLPAPDYAQRMIGWSGSQDCGAGIRIGMVDTGIDANLPALAGQKLHQRSFIGGDAVPALSDHGTAIASLLLGRADLAHADGGGLLPAADLYAASIFERHGDRSQASAFAIAAALDWMVIQHVEVVNVSLAGDANALMDLAVRRATERGTMVVAAAGNAGPTAPPAYPAAYPDVLAVTAVDQNANVLPEANRGDYIALSAPGVRIWTPGDDGIGQYETGTSFAAPFAAAALAAERKAGAPADAATLRLLLAAHALDLGAPGKDPVYGFGLLRVTASCNVRVSAP